MNNPELLFWAKTDLTGQDKKWTRPLWAHLFDVACVAEILWDTIISDVLKTQIAETLGCTEKEARSFISWLCGCHDIGKAIPSFQMQHTFSKASLEASGLRFPQNPHKKLRHEHATYKILVRWHQERFGEAEWFENSAFLLTFHHSRSTTQSDVDRISSDDLGSNWQQAQFALIDCTVEIFQPFFPEGVAQKKFWQAWTHLCMGLVSYADWIASMNTMFPYEIKQTPHEYLPICRTAAKKAIESIGGHFTANIKVERFEALFGKVDEKGEWIGFKPRTVQKAVIDYTQRTNIASEQSTPLLAIIEAPTADGKTEAALYLAAQLQAQPRKTSSRRGIYLAMPTQATSNGLLGRFLGFLERAHQADSSPANVLLVHGQSNLHETQDQLKKNMDNFIHGSSMEAICDSETDNQNVPSPLAATLGTAAWFLPKKRSLLAPFGIGTIDQALLSVLQARFFFLRLLGLHDKTVIFDEVHAYDAYMLTVLERLICWLKAAGSDVILLSATLPDTMRTRFLQTWLGKDKQEQLPPLPARYPALTFVRNDVIEHEPIYSDELPVPNTKETRPQSRTLDLEPVLVPNDTRQQIERIAELAVAAYNSGAAVGVICNTVKRSQQIFQKICELLQCAIEQAETQNCHLLHSRMTFVQRNNKESILRQCFGPDFQGERKGIVVGTQILEQSLDVDFDAMITDIAPIDLLLQRAGRLHRHLWRMSRPEAHSAPTLHIVIPEVSARADAPTFQSIASVYSDFIMQQTWRVLHKDNNPQAEWRTKWRVPEDVRSLVNAVYDEQTYAEFESESRLEKSLLKWSGEKISHTQQASKVLILPPAHAKYLPIKGITLLDDEGVESRLKAATRLEANSIRVICFHQGQNRQWFLNADCTIPFEDSLTTTSSGVRTLLNNSVTVSTASLVNAILSDARNQEEYYLHWQKLQKHSSGLLGIMPLVFQNNEWKNHDGSVYVSYHQILGLVINEKAS